VSARLLAQLMNSVKGALGTQVKIDFTCFWLDSITALYWIRNRGEWKQFVHHRVNEILKLTNKEDWGHCPGPRGRKPCRYRFKGDISFKFESW
jgi:hypothetical protein